MKAISKKVCIVGDTAVGKTQLVNCVVPDSIVNISTIGVRINRMTTLRIHQGQFINLTCLLWDLAGSKKFDHNRPIYFRGASGALLICDLTRFKTLATLYEYAYDLRSVNREMALIIVANKSDLVDQHQLPTTELQIISKRLKAPFFITNAKTGEKVSCAFNALAKRVLS